MEATIITLGDITGKSSVLPDRKIIKDAQKNMCLSAAFWAKIKAGKIPYTFDKDKKELVEAGYTETAASLKEEPKKSDIYSVVYWITDEQYPAVNKTLQNINKMNTMKQSFQDQIEKYKK